MAPGSPGVDGFVDAVAFVDPAAGDQVTCAHIDDVRIGGGDLDRADRPNRSDRIENWVPGLAGAGGFPDAAQRQASVEHSGLAHGAADRRDPPAAERADVAPHETSEGVRRYRREGEGGRAGEAGA